MTMANRKCAQVVHKELKDMPLPFADSARKHKTVEVCSGELCSGELLVAAVRRGVFTSIFYGWHNPHHL